MLNPSTQVRLLLLINAKRMVAIQPLRMSDIVRRKNAQIYIYCPDSATIRKIWTGLSANRFYVDPCALVISLETPILWYATCLLKTSTILFVKLV